MNGPPTGPVRALLLGALAVAVMVAAFPPFGAWPLALLAAWPATALVLEAPTPRAAALRGWLYGMAVLGLGTAWLAHTLWLNLVLVAVAGSMWHAAWGWACRRLLPSTGLLPAAPVLWVAMEMARLNWPLSGYPWMFLGHALAASPVLVQVADLGGVMLVSGVAASTGAAFLALRSGQRRGSWAAGLLLAAAATYGLLRPGQLPAGEPGPVVAAVQPNIAQSVKNNPATAQERYRRGLELSARALSANPPPDVLVWAETMWPLPLGEGEDGDVWFPAGAEGPAFGPRDARALSDPALAPLFAGGRTQLVLGAVWWRRVGGRVRPANSAVIFDAAGRVTGRHDKVFLVPGGEAVPFGELLPGGLRELVEAWIAAAANWKVDLVPGAGFAAHALGGAPAGVTICFENAYGEASRLAVASGARFLLNLSNEAWFGSSAEHDQMELQSILRAVETRRALLRCTNSGISSLLRPDGRRPAGEDRLEVGGRDRDVAGLLVARVPLHEGLTPYVRWGDWPGWAAVAGALLLLVLRRPVRVP